MNRSISRWAMLGITLLAAALRLYQLGIKSFWFDECFTYLVTAALPFNSAWQAIVDNIVHPPLYYLMLRPLLVIGGTSEYATRFLSAAFGVLAVPAIYCLGRRLHGKGTGVIAALLLAANPFHIWYSQDARMYAPLLFFSLVVMDCFVSMVRSQRRWVSLAVFSGLAYVTHYAALSLLYIQLVYLLPRLRQTQLVRRWFVVQAVALAPLALWFSVYLSRGVQLAGLGWIPTPGLLAPLYTLWNFSVADAETVTPLVAALAIVTAVIFVRALFPWNEERKLLIWWLALPIGLVFLLSLRRSYYVDRYFMASLPAYILLLALGITAWQNAVWRVLAMSAVLVAMIWGTARLYTDPLFAKEEWRGVTAAVEADLEPGDMVVMQDSEALVGTMAYRKHTWPSLVPSPDATSATLEKATAQYKRVWLIWRSPFESNHRLSKSGTFNVLQVAAPPVRDWLSVHQVALNLSLPGLSVVRVERAQ